MRGVSLSKTAKLCRELSRVAVTQNVRLCIYFQRSSPLKFGRLSRDRFPFLCPSDDGSSHPFFFVVCPRISIAHKSTSSIATGGRRHRRGAAGSGYCIFLSTATLSVKNPRAATNLSPVLRRHSLPLRRALPHLILGRFPDRALHFLRHEPPFVWSFLLVCLFGLVLWAGAADRLTP
ncbi:hypothetical protein DFJ73DRAFT_516611 [Zopfochytrium polystomum]|nr:hypothetical protein DFJ73DRAFT_516611 [Zopfochytrium polystomum]